MGNGHGAENDQFPNQNDQSSPNNQAPMTNTSMGSHWSLGFGHWSFRNSVVPSLRLNALLSLVLLVAFASLGRAADPLYLQPPFDELKLDEDNGGVVLRVKSLNLKGGKIPTTEAERAGERFDFWHSLFPHIEMRRTTGEGGYGAAALACAGDDGIAFTDLVCAPTASRFFDGRVDHMQLCAVVEGQFGVAHGKDERVWLGPGGGLQLLDCHRAAQTAQSCAVCAAGQLRTRTTARDARRTDRGCAEPATPRGRPCGTRSCSRR